MKARNVIKFWIGFGFAAAVAVWLVKLWREQRHGAPMHMWGPPPERSAPTPAARTEEVASPPDPLEKIHGIGPVTARRLKEAGVRTFAQLAAMTVEELEAIAGNTPWEPEDWIRQAAMLANG